MQVSSGSGQEEGSIGAHLIFSFDLGLPSRRFHSEMMSSFWRTLIVHPQISGHSPGGTPSKATASG